MIFFIVPASMCKSRKSVEPFKVWMAKVAAERLDVDIDGALPPME